MRAFIAVDIEASRATEGFLKALRATRTRVRVVPAENLHISLKFLGETDEGLVPFIQEALAGAVEEEEPFALTLHGSGAFPNLGNPRVLWIGVQGGEPLVRMAKRLERSLQELGFERERRRFTPHLTVGRVKSRRDLEGVTELLGSHRDDAFGAQRVEELRLKRSELRPTGALYHDVLRVPLG